MSTPNFKRRTILSSAKTKRHTYRISKIEDDKDKLLMQYELQGKKEKTTPSEPEKTFSEKIANAEESLKKMKQVYVRACICNLNIWLLMSLTYPIMETKLG